MKSDTHSNNTIERSVRIPPVGLEGDLSIPEGARGAVLFAHGSGSSRHSRRNQFVARYLNSGRVATLLIDLLTLDEERIDDRTAELRFDISLLARRLLDAVAWLRNDRDTRNRRIGLFGASTGGGAALVAAAGQPDAIDAVVSRGGRPDLAGPALLEVRCPTLLIVGGWDEPVIDMNQSAFEQLRCEKRMEVIPGATHLFEEPGKLEVVADLALDWFASCFGAAHRA